MVVIVNKIVLLGPAQEQDMTESEGMVEIPSWLSSLLGSRLAIMMFVEQRLPAPKRTAQLGQIPGHERSPGDRLDTQSGKLPSWFHLPIHIAL